jgi:hypothetical protein
MTTIEYCDNGSCSLNKKTVCTHPGPLDVDESGSCISAQYEEDGDIFTPYSEPPAPEPEEEDDDSGDDDVFFKRI